VLPDVVARCPYCTWGVTVPARSLRAAEGRHQQARHPETAARLAARITGARLANAQANARIAMWLVLPAHDPATTDRQVLLEVQQILLRAPEPESVAPGRSVTARPPPGTRHRDVSGDERDVSEDEWEEVPP
jgi:hypothetical protein